MTDDAVKILVVDDLPEKLLVYRTILEVPGQRVVTASSGPEALKQVLLHQFAMILLDVSMPGMNGFETAALIRKRKKFAHTPIIFVTAYQDDVWPIQGYAHGAVDYILSPVAPEVLRAKVRVFVDLFRMHQQVQRQAEERISLAEEQGKRAAAEEANRCSAFLADASKVLANSLDVEAITRGLACLVVPTLADSCIVCLADEHGRASPSAWAWSDAQRGTMVPPPAERPPLPVYLAPWIDHVLKTGQREWLADLDPPAATAAGESPDQGASAGATNLGLTSALVLPLAARGKTLGTLTLGLGPSGRTRFLGEMSVAEDLAYRTGIALDNAMLVRDVQQADRRKDEFLAMLAHELRNPLAPIRNAVEVMRQLETPGPELRWIREMIDRQLRRLTRLVDDLLDVSRITRGKIRLKIVALDVAAVVAGALETSRPLIEARKHELHAALPDEPLCVMADADRLAQVLSNLLNNAAKYTDEGGHIWLSVTREDDGAVFRVRDSGAGIPADMLPRIFDLFTQVDQSLDRSQGGLGIGLTLVRRLVEMHQGSVQAFSQGPGHGSEFVVRLPALAPRQHKTPAANGAAAPLSAASPRRVLVVDDNVDAAATLVMLARLHGHDVRTAHDGLTALETARDFRPEIVLLDIGLPGLNGYEVARRLRHQAEGDNMLIAAVTGYGQEADRMRSHQAGLDAHLVKPVDAQSLGQLLNFRSSKPAPAHVGAEAAVQILSDADPGNSETS